MSHETTDAPATLPGNGTERARYRNILVFSDGTGNSSGKLQRTNVWRAYKAVDLADPQNPQHPRQFAFYDDGVGTSSFRPIAWLGGAFGVGLARNVRDLYAFICRTYRPGDQIYCFGFSRGAFTIRVLVGLMMSQGLVPYDGSEANLQRNVAAAYRAYRRKRFGTIAGLEKPLRQLRDLFIRLRNRVCGFEDYAELPRIGLESTSDELHVRFVGVWDTVAAYGLPVDELTRAVDQYIWPLSMPDRDLNPRVERAMHALSLDDERNTFHPQLWNEGPPPASSGGVPVGPPNGGRRVSAVGEERLSQVWFAGAHSDVGGGYGDEAVSYVSLHWIMGGAQAAGVRFEPRIWQEYLALSDENGPVHDSRKGLAGYYRYNPRRIDRLTRTPEVRIERVKVHESALRRIKVGQDGYAPIVLPPAFDVVRIDGGIVEGGAYLNEGPESRDGQDGGSGTQRFDPEVYEADREHVFNLVWWRRIAYFVTLGATLLLALMPLLWPARPEGACSSELCFLSGLIKPIGVVLPGFASTWLDTFASRPEVFAPLALVVVAGLTIGQSLETTIRDAMRRIWYALPATRPSTGRSVPYPSRPGPVGRVIERLRTSAPYRRYFHLLTHRVMPAGFLLVVLYAAVAVLAQSVFAVRSAWGDVCPHPERTYATGPAVTRFETKALCAATGLSVTEGATYRLGVFIPDDDPWADAVLRAGPLGITPGQAGAGLLSLGVPLRRHIVHPWYKPFARIGRKGSDTYPLDAKPSVAWTDSPASKPTIEAIRRPNDVDDIDCARLVAGPPSFTAEFVARSTGDLFLYVNDALGPPFLTTFFYDNNLGRACVRLEVVRASTEPGAASRP
jgi:uncharacterized protein (DUF2235 family)